MSRIPSSRFRVAGDLMRPVPVVSPHDTLAALERVLLRNALAAVPVVDRLGMLVGIATSADADLGQATRPSAPDRTLRVDDVMTGPAISVEVDTAIPRVATVMARLRLHRLPVVRCGIAVGMISSLDLCRAIAEDGDAGLRSEAAGC